MRNDMEEAAQPAPAGLQHAMRNLHGSITELVEGLALLADHLEPVLEEARPVNEEARSVNEERPKERLQGAASPSVRHIEDMRETMLLAHSRLHDLMSRLDL